MIDRSYAWDAFLAACVVFVWIGSAKLYLVATGDPGAMGRMFMVAGLVALAFAALRVVRAEAYDDGLDARKTIELDESELPY